MSNPLDELRERYWINVYHSDKPNSPLCNLVLVEKDNKDNKFKYPVWKDKEKEGYGYVGKLDTFQPSQQAQISNEPSYPQDDDDSNSIPF